MADTKYGYLLKQLKYEKVSEASAGGKPDFMTKVGGADLEGMDISFAHGFRRQLGKWGSDGGMKHAHPYNETLMFAGLDYDNPNKLGAVVEVSLGENGETYTIESPTVIALPAGIPHGPLVTRQADIPFGFLSISCAGEHKISVVHGPDAASGMGKYTDLVQPFEMHYMKRENSGNADYMTGWSGAGMEGFSLNFTWAFHTGTGRFHTHDPHVHPNDEVLVFVGTDPDNPDYLGAEVEIFMGEELESHIFSVPTVIIAPAGLVHCPLAVRKVEKPYNFTAICLNNSHDTTWLGGDPNEPNRYAHPPKRK